MRILVLSNLYPPDFIGGYELCCRQVVDGLLRNCHQVCVLTSVPRLCCPPLPHVSRLLRLSNRYDSYANQWSLPATRRLWETETNFVIAHNVHVLLQHLQDFQPDVVYLWNLVGLGGLGLVGCLQHLAFPWVWYLGDCVPRLLCSAQHEPLPVLAEQFSRHVRGHYMPVSSRVVEEIESGGVSLNGRVEIMPNWVEGQRPVERTRYFQPGRRLKIVSAGQVGPHKGTDLLIECAGLLRSRGYDGFTIDLFGHVTNPVFAQLIRQWGVEEHVTLRGLCPQEELVERYRAHEYDVFAFPTWDREPFGCAPLEAGAYGCVMLMSQSCGIAEWFVNGVHCLKTARTADAFATALARIIDGEVSLEELGKRATTVIWRDFHLNALLPQIEAALARAARASRNGAGTPAEAYGMALMAERLAQALVQQAA